MITERENILRCYRHETPERLPDFSQMHILFPINGFLERPRDNGSGKDWFGVDWLYEDTGKAPIPDPRVPPIVSNISKWREMVKFPDLDNWDWDEAVKIDKPDQVDKENKVLAVWILNGIFERVQTLLGMEESLVSLMTNTDEMYEFITTVADYKLKLYEKIIEYYKPDIICQHDDYGTQISMLLSPDLWRRLIKPNTARFVELCNKHNVIFEQHSCGLIEPIVPDLYEIGVSGWQGMHINDVPKLKKLTDNRFNFFMTLDIQKYQMQDAAGKLTEESLRKDVRDTIVASAKGGNYIPFIYSIDETWWGINIIMDEIDKCRKIVTY